MRDLKDAIKLLNIHLQGKQYLVGDHITVADIVAGVALILPYQVALDGGFRKAMPNTAQWLENLVKLPEFVSRFGNVKFAAKTVKPQLTQAAPKEKEQAKPAAQKKPEGDEEEPKKKEANPLDVLPPTPFDLFAFKTFFVNHKDKRGEGMKFFFENYDKEGYSIYFVHYDKYEGEGVVLYQTSNMMNGFL